MLAHAAHYDFLLKAIIVGDSAVGKSCLLLRFVDKRYRPNHEVTIGVEFGSRVVDEGPFRYKLHIWDTAGQENFRSITRMYYRQAALALLVYDITNRNSFEHLQHWASDVEKYAPRGVVLVVVANKIDLCEHRLISADEGSAFADRLGAAYHETSALAAEGVDEAFLAACVLAIQRSEAAKASGERPQESTTSDPVQRCALWLEPRSDLGAQRRAAFLGSEVNCCHATG